jgi:hypothetical protein
MQNEARPGLEVEAYTVLGQLNFQVAALLWKVLFQNRKRCSTGSLVDANKASWPASHD